MNMKLYNLYKLLKNNVTICICQSGTRQKVLTMNEMKFSIVFLLKINIEDKEIKKLFKDLQKGRSNYGKISFYQSITNYNFGIFIRLCVVRCLKRFSYILFLQFQHIIRSGEMNFWIYVWIFQAAKGWHFEGCCMSDFVYGYADAATWFSVGRLIKHATLANFPKTGASRMSSRVPSDDVHRK